MLRRIVLAIVVALAALLVISIAIQAEIPAPTGDLPVGTTTIHWIDMSREEPLMDTPDDHREVIVRIWYPAQAGTGTTSPYFPDLDTLADGLRQSGTVNSLEVAGLPLVRSHVRQDAIIADAADIYPVILLSPGNEANVEFYAAFANDLASHGYIVVGLNHPFDVSAVRLQDGTIAVFRHAPTTKSEYRDYLAERMAQRFADITFARDQLEALNTSEDSLLAGRLDLQNIAVMGHSLGGIAAAMVCADDLRYAACLNMDGLQEGGPFGIEKDPALPTQPFLFITKEESLPPLFTDMFDKMSSEGYMVITHGATHQSFSDGPVLLPSLLPFPNRTDRILNLNRKYIRAFFDHTLKGKTNTLLLESVSDDVSVIVYSNQETTP
jgi:pimeloyl-ACP methyl ester carboxylesterase